MFDLSKTALKDNPSALAELTSAEGTITTQEQSLSATTGKLTDSIKSRDKAKNENILFRNKFGVDNSQEINDEFLETIGAKKTADIKKIEEKYKAELEKSATALTDQKTSFDTRLKASAMKAALAEVAASAGLATNPHLVEAFQHELGKGASLGDDGTITYQDDNGVPQFYEGKPLTVATRIEQMKQVETNDVFFGSTTSQGTGNTGGGGGNAPAGVSRKSLLADNAAMSDYFKDHSSKDFEALPSE